MSTTTKHTPFGEWFYSLPKTVRMRILSRFDEAGINTATVRGWMHRETTPRGIGALKAVEKITGHKAEDLFPY